DGLQHGRCFGLCSLRFCRNPILELMTWLETALLCDEVGRHCDLDLMVRNLGFGVRRSRLRHVRILAGADHSRVARCAGPALRPTRRFLFPSVHMYVSPAVSRAGSRARAREKFMLTSPRSKRSSAPPPASSVS